MTTPVICHISSAHPEKIEKIYAQDPDFPGRYSGTTEFNAVYDGHTYLADIVFKSADWKVFEDNTLIARGKERVGEVMVPVSSVRTAYLRTFLEWLL